MFSGKEKGMCDYSLHGIKNRLAEEGETLVVHKFHTGSKGLTSVRHLQPQVVLSLFKYFHVMKMPKECAVCIPDGARLQISRIPAQILNDVPVPVSNVVTFRQLSAEAGSYRDYVKFSTGAVACLQEFEEGTEVKVLSLAPADESAQKDNLKVVQAH